jgi:hypothetical protein
VAKRKLRSTSRPLEPLAEKHYSLTFDSSR